ncbi:MAG: hypothetical protein AB8C95_07500 [Phycisphaeraceae bacterium]
MKTLIGIAMIGVLGTTAFNPPPLREGPGEGAEQSEIPKQVTTASQHHTLPQPLPQGRGVQNDPIELVQELATTFATIDITLDPLGQPLAAYQFELTSDDASFTVVGVESGEHAAFDHGRPPYFDPIATQGKIDRLILAEYALPDLATEQLPTDVIRVATVHVMFAGQLGEDEQHTIQLKLTTVGNADGERIEADISYSFRTPERPQSR